MPRVSAAGMEDDAAVGGGVHADAGPGAQEVLQRAVGEGSDVGRRGGQRVRVLLFEPSVGEGADGVAAVAAVVLPVELHLRLVRAVS